MTYFCVSESSDQSKLSSPVKPQTSTSPAPSQNCFPFGTCDGLVMTAVTSLRDAYNRCRLFVQSSLQTGALYSRSTKARGRSAAYVEKEQKSVVLELKKLQKGGRNEALVPRKSGERL